MARILIVEDDYALERVLLLTLAKRGHSVAEAGSMAEAFVMETATEPPFDLIILDDISYGVKDQAETSVLFELIAERYERRSLLITANQPFSGWNNIFPDPGMTVAAIDRLVHHSTIFELNVESYRRRTASDKQSARRRQSSTTTIQENQP